MASWMALSTVFGEKKPLPFWYKFCWWRFGGRIVGSYGGPIMASLDPTCLGKPPGNWLGGGGAGYWSSYWFPPSWNCCEWLDWFLDEWLDWVLILVSLRGGFWVGGSPGGLVNDSRPLLWLNFKSFGPVLSREGGEKVKISMGKLNWIVSGR